MTVKQLRYKFFGNAKRAVTLFILTMVAAAGISVMLPKQSNAVVLSANSADFVMNFTGVTTLPATQTFLNPVNLQVAWTLNGASPLNSDFIYMTTPGSCTTPAYCTVYAPVSGTGPSGSVAAKTVIASDVITMTVRAVDNTYATSNLAGYVGSQSSVGQMTATSFAQHGANSNNSTASELISFGTFPNFWTLSDAFARVTSSFLLNNVQLPSTVTDLSYTFGNNAGAGFGTSCNAVAISSWNVSNVTNLTGTFLRNTTFNQPLSTWNISKVTSLAFTFQNASAFNQSLSTWDTSAVTTMESTFQDATTFNNGLASGVSGTLSWNTANVTSLRMTFFGSSAFNQNVNSWNTSKVTTMYCTFSSTNKFNQPLTSWDTSNVTTMFQMFNQAWVFNNGMASGASGTLQWNTSKVTTMSTMFQGSSLNGYAAFNQNINGWDVSHVTDFSTMFFRAWKFNQPLNSWNTSAATNMNSMFSGTPLFNQPLSNWDTSNVTNMGYMFSGATAFNQDLSNFKTLRVTAMLSMFNGATKFNNGLAAGVSGSLPWITSSVTSFQGMFGGATSMNLSLISFNVNNAAGNGTTASSFIEFPTSMDSNNVQQTLIAWSQENIPTTSLTYIKLYGQNIYSDCASYTAYLKLTSAPAAVSFAGTGVTPAAPAGCATQATSSVLTWAPTTSITAPTFSQGAGIYTFTPEAAVSTGSAFEYISRSGGCSVSPTTGLVTYTYFLPSPSGSTAAGSSPGTCVLRVIETTSAGSLHYLDVTFTLYRYTVPGAPTPSLTYNGTSMTINWVANVDNGRKPVTAFNVTTTAGGFSCAGAASDTSCTITGLTLGTSYTFNVTATNEIGSSIAGTVTGTANALPGAPTITGITQSASATLTIAFTAGTNTGTAVTNYKYSTDGGTTWKLRSPTATSSPWSITTNSSATPTSLVNGTTYGVLIRAVNSKGDGVASNQVSIAPDVAPNAPTLGTIVVGNNSLSVPFTAPSPLVGSTITNYQYSTDGGTTWLTRSPAATTSPISITTLSDGSGSALTNGTSYNIKLRAFNTMAGAASVAQSATPLSPPGPVSNITGTPGNGQVALTWTASVGTVTDYTVEYSTTGSTFSTFSHAASTASSITVTGLTNGTAYVFRIAGVNSIGTGSSVTSSYYRPEVAPNAPTLGSIVAGNGSLTVPFTSPSASGSAVTNYEYSTDGGTTWLTRSPVSTSSPLTITVISDGSSSLISNGTAYNIKLRAVNTMAGAASLAQSATPVSPPGAVSNINGTAGSTQVALTWTAPNSGTVTDYTVEYSSDGVSFTAFSHSASTATSMTVTGLTNGTSYVFRITALNGGVASASALSDSFTPRAVQATLTISSSASVAYLSTLTLTTTGGSGTGTVYFTALSGSACSVVGNILTPGEVGSTCNIMATKLGDATYTSKDSATRAITVTQISQANTLAFANASAMTYGQSFTLNALGGSGTGAYQYSVTNAGATGCSVNATTGALTTTGSGTCQVGVKRLTSTNYLESSVVTQSIVVTTADQSISFTSTIPISPVAGRTYIPAATATSGLSPSFTIASGPCSISGGVVSFTSSGVCVINADESGNSQYSAAPRVSQTITIGKRNQNLYIDSGITSITQIPFDFAAFGVEAFSSESNAVITFSNNSAMTNNACSISSSGLVTINAVGICAIQADAAGTSAYAAASPAVHTFAVVPVVATAPFITSISAGNKAITASFTEPSYLGGSAVSGYTLVAVPQNSTAPTVTETGCSTTLVSGEATCTVRGLIDGVTYKVKVAAINGAGVGPYTELSNGLLVASNPEAVQQLRVSQQNAQLVINWNDPDSLGGGVFVSYRIFIKLASSANFDPSYYEITDSTIHSLTATHQSVSGPILQNGTAYDVKVLTVTAANSRELTANVAIANQIPRTVPGAPRYSNALVSGSALVVTWQVPLTDGGAAISSYTAQVNSQNCVFAQALDNFCTVAKPAASGSITYAIAAVNVAGAGDVASGTDDVTIPGSTPTGSAPSTRPRSPNSTVPEVSASPTPSGLNSDNGDAQVSPSPSSSSSFSGSTSANGTSSDSSSVFSTITKSIWWLLLLLIIPIRRQLKRTKENRKH